jgi:hypothetical protein
MADCPNCGRQTLRTKDWVCQWCGYPLISHAFKVIDKTYKEIQQERLNVLKQNSPKEKFEFKLEYKPELEPTKEPPAKSNYVAPAEPEPRPQPQYNQVPLPLEEPVTPDMPMQLTEPAPAFEPVEQEPPVTYQTQPGPEPTPTLEPVAENPPEQPVMVTPPPQSEVPPPQAVEPVTESTPPPQPEVIIKPEPVPEPAIKPEDIQDDMELNTDVIDLLFRRDKEAADDGLTGKTIVIKGVVDKIFVREHLDIRYIMLTNAKKDMNWNLRCTFNKEESSKLGRLQEGQEVAVRGKYEGYSKNIIFRDCELV